MRTRLFGAWKTLPVAALLFAFWINARAQNVTQNFSWTVTGTGTETWYTDDLVYHTVQVSGNQTTDWTVGVSGTAYYSDNVSAIYDDGSAGCGVTGYFNDYDEWVGFPPVELGDPGKHSGSFTVTAGGTYDLYANEYDGGASLSVSFPYDYQWDAHTATRTNSETGSNSVSVPDGQKNCYGFYCPPQPQNGGTMSNISYSVACANPNVELFFSDTETTTTANPNAYIIAVAPLPGEVTYVTTTTNYAVSGRSSTIGNAWSPTPWATGYEFVSAKYFNGVWQTPVTNAVAGTSFLDTGIPPGTPCEYYVIATNVSGAAAPSVTSWPFAAVPPLPGQATSLWTTTNHAVSGGSVSIGTAWSPTPWAAGYELVSDKYINGVWQTPVTNAVAVTSFLDTGIPPGTPCEYYVIATNFVGNGMASPTNWPFAVGPYLGVPQMIPGHIQVQDYDVGGNGWAYNGTDPTNHGDFRTSEGVELTDSEIAETGYYKIFYTSPGEWVNYTVNVQHSGLYSIILSAGKIDGASTNHIEIDGVNVTGPLMIANTGSWNYQLLRTDGIYLASGLHVLRLAMDGCGPDWGNGNFNDLNVVADAPQIQAIPGSLGVWTNHFGFTITGLSNQVVVIEGCTNLYNPNWVPLQTNVLGTNALLFGDPAWTNYRSRFYRVFTP